jgi:tetratricopeptide (TPR) repeat protein
MNTSLSKRYLYLAALLALIFAVGSPVTAGGRSQRSGTSTYGGSINQEIDYLGVAAVMIRDGNYERAEAALAKVDPDTEGIDAARFYTLRGLLLLRRGLYSDSLADFDQAIQSGQDNAVIYAYLAQTKYALGDYAGTIDALETLRTINQYPELLEVKAMSLWHLGEIQGAFETLDRAMEIYPERHGYLRQKILLLIELDLYQEAAEQSEHYLTTVGDDPAAYITIGEALRRGGEFDRAIHILEMAKLKYPENRQVLLALTNAYAYGGRHLTAARLVESAAISDPRFYYEAAELYRRAGILSRATYMNSLVSDQEKKTAQRFQLCLERQKFEEALALEPRMIRLGLVSDDAMKYAMAYVHFYAQHFERAEAYLNQITGSEYFREAVQLRKAIEVAKDREDLYFR